MDSQHLSSYVDGPTAGPICEDAKEDKLEERTAYCL